MDDKLDKIHDRLSSIDITLTRNTVALEEHIKRTNLLEEKISQIVEDIKPVQAHVSMVQGALKLLGALAIAAEAVHLWLFK